MTRAIGVVTTARSDFGIYLPVLRAVEAHPALDLRLIVGGMHLAPEFGETVRLVEAAGFTPHRRLPYLRDTDTAAGTAGSIGAGVTAFAAMFAEWRPDILVVLGDRFDMLPAAVAALPFRIPVAHLHGGEVTEGAIDDAIRHAITKLSHLHFVTTEDHARRVRQLGEEDWRVTVSGAPGLDTLLGAPARPRAQVLGALGLDAARPLLLVTYHAATLEPDGGAAGAEALARVLVASDAQVVATAPNADPGHAAVRAPVEAFVAAHPDRARWIENAGLDGYRDLLAAADAMVGNSSSGIIEAPSFALPVLNIGSRQRGRQRGENVIDVEPVAEAIADGLAQALAPGFRLRLRGVHNPYGSGDAAHRIVQRLATVDLGPSLVTKRFIDR